MSHEISLTCTSQNRRLHHHQQKNPTKSVACTDQGKFDCVMKTSIPYSLRFPHLLLGVCTVGMDLCQDLDYMSLDLDKL